jgi:glycosyltransferase involved in cell wall biosynthesis
MNPLRKTIAAFRRRARDRRIIADSGVFDRDWYLAQNPPARAASDPLAHYLHAGADAGLDPNPLFDTKWYLDRYPDIRAAGLNPLAHYLERGAAEGRNPHPLFDSHWYLEQNPDARAAGLNPLVHYLHSPTGRDPNPLFDSTWYLEQNPDVRAAGTNPLAHYVTAGAALGRDPNRLFKGRWYLEQNPGVAASGLEPLAHYIHFGVAEGRDPNPMFDTDWYLAHNPDVVRAQLNPLGHYLREGAAEGRAPNSQHRGSWYLEQFSARAERAPQWPLPQGAPQPAASVAIACDVVADRPDATAAVLAAAIGGATQQRRHLLVVMAGMPPPPEDINRLTAAFDADPMIGYAMPRCADASGLIHPLRADAAASGYDRAILAHLPAVQLAPEFLAGCVLIRRELVANMPDLVGHFSTLAGLLRALMAWGRRLGYRAAIANNVVVADVARDEARPRLSAAEQAALVRLFPDALVADTRFNELSCHRRETLAGLALSPGRRRLLIDCTGMQPYHNGTSECALGILDGLAAIGTTWQVDIMAAPATADYHALRQRYGAFTVVDAPSVQGYVVAIRLSQPWTLESIAELHEHALHLMFMMLDTIAWDIVYSATPEVERTWSFAAAHADSFLYDSGFTRDRFRFRFPLAAHARELVTHLSCNFADYDAVPARRDAGHILLIGNDHEHKGMAQALDLLPRAFPRERFVVIGHDDLGLANVRSVKSGKVTVEGMRELYAGSRMLVFPSFYEGFGFPVAKGLAHGLDVVARRSDLLTEIAGQCAQRGRIVPFDDPASLIDAVRRILTGESVATVPLGTGLGPGQEPPGWRDIAARIVALIDDMAAQPGLAVRDRREAALRHVFSAGYSAFKASKATL